MNLSLFIISGDEILTVKPQKHYNKRFNCRYRLSADRYMVHILVWFLMVLALYCKELYIIKTLHHFRKKLHDPHFIRQADSYYKPYLRPIRRVNQQHLPSTESRLTPHQKKLVTNQFHFDFVFS